MSKPNKEEVIQMFNSISNRYDMLNHILSFGIDKLWRKKLIKSIQHYNPKNILDIATGTADLAIAAVKIKPESVTGIDISEELLKIAQRKIKSLALNETISLINADAEQLPFDNNNFDAIIIAFGIRNFENPAKCLLEMSRVLKKNGIVAILEFSLPSALPVKLFYSLYFRYLLPTIGTIISGSRNAYKYLPNSVFAFPHGSQFLKLLKNAGFSNLRQIKLSLGIASIYLAEKI